MIDQETFVAKPARRCGIGIVGALCLLAANVVVAADTPARPNIVFILADDK